jgi:uncharacterized protein (DUF433 family)
MPALEVLSQMNRGGLAIYTYADAERYLGIPQTTVRYWARGGIVTKDSVRTHFHSVLSPSVESGLTFTNLVELYVLKALRQVHEIRLEAIRRALDFATGKLGIDRPLLVADLYTLGGDIFVDHLGGLIALTRGGQQAMKHILASYLDRVEHEHNIPIKLYPFVNQARNSRPVRITPTTAFGRPTVGETGIQTAVVADRVDAGELPDDIARDYGLDASVILDALAYEFRQRELAA